MKNTKMVLGIIVLALIGLVVSPVENNTQASEPIAVKPAQQCVMEPVTDVEKDNMTIRVSPELNLSEHDESWSIEL